MKNNKMVAKVNKEIGGWDYRGYHIDRDNQIGAYIVQICGDEICAKTLGKAKEIIDEQVALDEKKNDDKNVVAWVSKRGTEYLLQVVNGKIKAFTYEAGKKRYWTVTKEIREFAACML